MLAWFRDLSRLEKRTFWGCVGGWSMDAMDMQLFNFLIPSIIVALHITRTDAGLLGTASLLSSALGGWLAGVLSDRYGRVRIMKITILWYAVSTVLCGFTSSFNQLLAVRVLQGLGFGGEWAAGAVLLGEIIRPEHRGKAVGCVQAAYPIGWGLASLVSTLALVYLPNAWSWRAVFFFGGLPALLLLFMRRNMQDAELYTRMKSQISKPEDQVSLFTIFKPGILKTTLLTSLLAIGLHGGSNTLTVWLPTFLRTSRHMTAVGTGSSVGIISLGALCGCLVCAFLSDNIGRKKVFLVYIVGSLCVVSVYTLAPISSLTATILGFPLGFTITGIFSAVGPFFSELFPTRMRGTGQSFAYNTGRGVSALLITLVGMASEVIPLAQAIGIASACCYALAVIAILLLPETRGIDLSEVVDGSLRPDAEAKLPQPESVLTRGSRHA